MEPLANPGALCYDVGCPIHMEFSIREVLP